MTSEKPEVSEVENATERSQLARKRKAEKNRRICSLLQEYQELHQGTIWKSERLCPHSLPLVEFFIQILETLGLCEMTDRLTTVPSGRVSSSSLTDTTVPELSLFCSESRVPQ